MQKIMRIGQDVCSNRQMNGRNAERSTYNGHSRSVIFSTYIGDKLPVDFNKTYTGNIAEIPTTLLHWSGNWMACNSIFKKSQTFTG